MPRLKNAREARLTMTVKQKTDYEKALRRAANLLPETVASTTQRAALHNLANFSEFGDVYAKVVADNVRQLADELFEKNYTKKPA